MAVSEHRSTVNILKGLNNQFKYIYLRSRKSFLNFLLYVWNLHQLLNILKKKMTIIADVFSKLQTSKVVVR